ncbi:MAG: SH3 domain-containing protein [Chloroflexota bacterium]
MRRLMLFILFAAVLTISAPATAQQGNLLQNASFDSEVYTPVSFDPAVPSVYLAVPQGWNGAVIQAPRTEPWMNIHPTGLPHIGPIKVDGYRSYHVARGGGTFTAYIFQQVNVEPGTTVQGGAWVFIEGNTGVARVGIDPNGGTNPFAPGIVWQETVTRFGWSTPTVNATASGGTVTLFLFATQGVPANPNGVYWDAAFLNGTAGAPSAAPAAAAPPPGGQQTLRTTVGRLNVRSNPAADSRVLGIITPGNRYNVLAEEGGWYRIDYGGQPGYVAARFVQVSAGTPAQSAVSAPAANTDVTYTTNAPLRIRSGPTTDAAIISRIPWGLTAAVVGRTLNNRWVQVEYDGVVGWSAVGFGSIDGNLDAVPVTR